MQNETPFFSIVIPLYNKSKYIQTTLNSILSQTFMDYEIVVVNDGSTDDSLDIVNKYDSSKVRIFTQVNQGVSIARNLGIKKSKGQWIAFIDADDIWDEKYLEKAFNTIKSFPKAEILGMNYKVDSESRSQESGRDPDIGPNSGYIYNYFKLCLSRYLFNSSSVIVKRECFDIVGYFSTILKEAEDLEMWYRLIKQFTLCYNSEILSFYRKDHNVQLTRQKKIKLENYWAYHIKFDNITNREEYIYLSYRVASLVRVLVSHKRFRDLILLIKNIGLCTISKVIILVFYKKKIK